MAPNRTHSYAFAEEEPMYGDDELLKALEADTAELLKALEAADHSVADLVSDTDLVATPRLTRILQTLDPSLPFSPELRAELVTQALARATAAPPARGAKRARCRAHNRKGEPCKAQALPGKRVCRHHGGLSTGPKTEAGRAAIAESNRRRARRSGTLGELLRQMRRAKRNVTLHAR